MQPRGYDLHLAESTNDVSLEVLKYLLLEHYILLFLKLLQLHSE